VHVWHACSNVVAQLMLFRCIASSLCGCTCHPPGPYSSMHVRAISEQKLLKAQRAVLIQDAGMSTAVAIYAYAAILQIGIDHLRHI